MDADKTASKTSPADYRSLHIRSDGTRRLSLLEVRVGQHNRIVLRRPPVWILDPAGVYYETNGVVWLPFVELSSGSITAMDAFRTAFDFLGENWGVQLLIAGHTDAVGSEGANLDLATRRAELVHLFLEGKRSEWASACASSDTVSLWQRVLTWATLFLGWDCHPGEIDDDLGPVTAGALERFRATYNEEFDGAVPTDGGFSVQDWEAVFDLYERELARALALPSEDFVALRAQLVFTSPATLGCGESFPAGPCGPSEEEVWNRRVDLIFCKGDHLPALEPEPPGTVVYGDHVNRMHISVNPRALEPLGRLWFVMLSQCGQEPVPHLDFTLVRGSRSIKGRTDAHGRYDAGAMLSGLYELRIGDGGVVCPTIALDDADPYPLYFFPEITREGRESTGETPDEDEEAQP